MNETTTTKRVELIDDWRQAWRLYSVHALLVAAVLGVAEAALAAAHLAWVPEWVFGALTALAAVSGIVGRVVKQDPDDAARIADLKS